MKLGYRTRSASLEKDGSSKELSKKFRDVYQAPNVVFKYILIGPYLSQKIEAELQIKWDFLYLFFRAKGYIVYYKKNM